jgi:glycosyltransferase involved in cell wall biosynthesis
MEQVYKNYHVEAMFTHLSNGTESEEDVKLRKFIENKDVITIQRRYGIDWENFAKMCKERSKVVVYELDDVWEKIPLENLKLDAINMTKPDTRKSVIKMMRIADTVTVSTPELMEWVCKYVEQEKVYYFKNTLDFSMWPKPHFGLKEEGKDYIIGFAGSESHKTDLRELDGSLEIVNSTINKKDKTNVRFGFFGLMLKEFWNMSPHVSFNLGVKFLDYPPTLSLLHFSIGLAPLKQCLFNECKSELRFLEHAACGVPVVATNIAPFRRCITPDRGILVENKSRHWVQAIKSLLLDDAKRETMGRNSYDYVKENYNIDNYVTEWNKLYSTLI